MFSKMIDWQQHTRFAASFLSAYTFSFPVFSSLLFFNIPLIFVCFALVGGQKVMPNSGTTPCGLFGDIPGWHNCAPYYVLMTVFWMDFNGTFTTCCHFGSIVVSWVSCVSWFLCFFFFSFLFISFFFLHSFSLSFLVEFNSLLMKKWAHLFFQTFFCH